MENPVKSAKSVIDIVLIADDSAKAAMLRRFLENNGIRGHVSRIAQRKKALAYIQHKGPRSTIPVPDLILFDFSEPRDRVVSLLQDAVFGSTAPIAPVIVLTSPSSEQLLESGAVHCGNATMFAPKTLVGFVRKMRDHQRDRFLRAVSVLSDLGPILVRLPDSFSHRFDGFVELSA